MTEKRSHKLRNGVIGGFGGLLAGALLLLRCGGEIGLPGSSSAGAEGSADAGPRAELEPAVDAGRAARCRLRLDKDGLALAGERAAVAEVTRACREAGEAELLVTGDANYGTFQRLRGALADAGVGVYVR